MKTDWESRVPHVEAQNAILNIIFFIFIETFVIFVYILAEAIELNVDIIMSSSERVQKFSFYESSVYCM